MSLEELLQERLSLVGSDDSFFAVDTDNRFSDVAVPSIAASVLDLLTPPFLVRLPAALLTPRNRKPLGAARAAAQLN